MFPQPIRDIPKSPLSISQSPPPQAVLLSIGSGLVFVNFVHESTQFGV